MNNKMFTGSICLSDLIEQANRGHSAFVKAQNKKIYLSCIVWENEEPDKFGNTISFQLSSLKEKEIRKGEFISVTQSLLKKHNRNHWEQRTFQLIQILLGQHNQPAEQMLHKTLMNPNCRFNYSNSHSNFNYICEWKRSALNVMRLSR